jgi:hypothetical protein
MDESKAVPLSSMLASMDGDCFGQIATTGIHSDASSHEDSDSCHSGGSEVCSVSCSSSDAALIANFLTFADPNVVSG